MNEHLKHCPLELIKVIVKFFNIILHTGTVPSDWCTSMFKPIDKYKGLQDDPNNYIGITFCLAV